MFPSVLPSNPWLSPLTLSDPIDDLGKLVAVAAPVSESLSFPRKGSFAPPPVGFFIMLSVDPNGRNGLEMPPLSLFSFEVDTGLILEKELAFDKSSVVAVDVASFESWFQSKDVSPTADGDSELNLGKGFVFGKPFSVEAPTLDTTGVLPIVLTGTKAFGGGDTSASGLDIGTKGFDTNVGLSLDPEAAAIGETSGSVPSAALLPNWFRGALAFGGIGRSPPRFDIGLSGFETNDGLSLEPDVVSIE